MRSLMLFMLLGLDLLSLAKVHGQAGYVDVPKEDAIECVLEFVECREAFKNYGCLSRVQSQKLSKWSMVQATWETIVFEDKTGRRRTDVKMSSLTQSVDGSDDLSTEYPIWTTYFEKEKKRFFENGVDIDAANVNGLAQFHFVPDPWMAAITEGELLALAQGGDGNYWTKVLDESNLLWSEENDQFLRGEWQFGTGEGKTYVQVYFQKEPHRLPVKVRYIVPHDWNQRFSEKGPVVTENEIDWRALDDGFVPTAIRCQRQDLWVGMPGVKFTSLRSTDMFWTTKLRDKDGMIVEDVFVPKKLTFDEVKSSFVIKSPKSPDLKK